MGKIKKRIQENSEELDMKNWIQSKGRKGSPSEERSVTITSPKPPPCIL